MNKYESLAPIVDRMEEKWFPRVVVHCGSTSKCQQQFQRAALYDTIRAEPRQFFTIGCSVLSDAEIIQSGVEIDKDGLDALHFWKIHTAALIAQKLDTVSEVLILDLTDTGHHYIGESASRELLFANMLIEQSYPLEIRYWSLEQDDVRQILRDIVL